MKNVVVCLIGALAVGALADSLLALPRIQSPEAPFAPKTVELETPTLAIASDRVTAGTKSLTWQNRSKNIDILANGRAVASWQARADPSKKWDPFNKFTLVSERGGRIIRSCRFLVGTFTQEFSIEGDRAVVVSKARIDEGEKFKNLVMPLEIPFDLAVGRRLLVQDRAGKVTEITLPQEGDWGDRSNDSKLWAGNGGVGAVAEFTYDPDHPEFSFTIRYRAGDYANLQIYRAKSGAFVYATPVTKAVLGAGARFEVVFGKCAKANTSDSVVNGVNFTKNNAFEVPSWGKRNLLRNPSFEGDTRYYHAPGYCGDSRRQLVEDAHTGRWAIKLGGGNFFANAVRPNRKHTFSCWAKNANGDGGTVFVSATHYTWGPGKINNRPMSLKKGVKDWQRVSFTFDWPYKGIMLSIGNGGDKKRTILVDDVQLEEGETATEFECPPFAMTLRTDSPDYVFGNVDQVFNPRVLVRGRVGSKAVAKITVKDFFGRETYSGETPFTVGGNGEVEFAACPESAVAAKGVNVIRVAIDSGDGCPVVDHLRIVRYRYATGEEPSRELHMNECFGWGTRYQLDIDPWNFHRANSQGLCMYSRDLSDWWGAYDEKMRKDIAAFYLGNKGRIKQELFNGTVSYPGREGTNHHPIWKYLNEEGLAWEKMPDVATDYTEAELAMVERAVHRLVKENPWCTDWIGTSELGVRWNMTKIHDYKLYVRFMMAAHRGLKRANPKATFIVHGTCNAGQQGRAELHEVMEATKAIDPNWAWDGLQVHPYRGHPEFPSLEADLKLLFDDMAKHNMPNGLVYADEGCYFFPMIVNEWNDISPWAGTLEKDQYCHMHHPGYDLGWGEKMSAAMTMRYNLQCYKFMPRIKYVTSWNLRPIDHDNPIATYIGTAAETELLGYAKYLKDVRFGVGARAYFFDDGKGACVAAVWKFNVALDKGTETAAEMTLALPKGCEIYDMMANRVKGYGDEGMKGGFQLPLSNFPIFLKVPMAERVALEKAIDGAKTSDDGCAKKLYDPPEIKIAKCGGTPDWSKIEPIALPHHKLGAAAARSGMKWGGPDDFSAAYRIAWNEKGLFLRIEVKDDVFCLDHANKACTKWGVSQWYSHEGVQVFFDTLGDARENFKMEMTDNDDNDTSYELVPSNATTCVVFRRDAPDIQQTGGVGDALKSNVVVPEIPCGFRWDESAKTRTYEVFFPARQLMPMQLVAGEKMGMSFYVFDRDAPGDDEGKQTLSDVPTEIGSPFRHPYLYSTFRFAE